MIKAEKLKKEFRVHGNVFKILEDIDIEINDGEFIAIMGPSGAGKSTLLNILSTIERPTSGSVKYDAKEVFNMKNKEISKFRKDNIGFIFQDYTLLNILSTIERPTSGSVKYDAKEVFNMKNKEISKFRKDNIGFIFQDYNLIDSMSIDANIALPMVISGENYKKIEK